MAEAKRDENRIPTLLGVSSADGVTPVTIYADPTTHRLYVDTSGSSSSPLTTKGDIYVYSTVNTRLPVGTDGQILSADSGETTGLKWITASGTGTVTSVSVVTANGVSGSVATATTTPAITLTLGSITPSAVQISGLTASEIVITDASKNLVSAAVATYPSLTELSYVKGVTSAIQTQLNAKGAGTVTTVSVASANGFAGTVANATTTPAITLTTSVTGILKGNATAISAATAGSDYAVGSIGLAGGQTIAGSTLTAENLTLRANAADTTTGSVAITTSTASTTKTTGALTVAGGVGVAGAINANSMTLTSGLPVASGGTGGTSASITLFNNITGFSAAGTTGTTSTNLVFSTSPSLTTPTLGVATATSINGLTITSTTGTLTMTNAKTLAVTNTLTLSGTDSTVMTFPSTSATIARTDAANTFTGAQTFSNAVIYTNNAIAASGNAATVPITAKLNTVTNNSAATLTITMTTTSATDGQMTIVRVLDASAAAQTITWVNTENSTVSAPTTSNGSTTLPLTVGFMYNSATSKWRCIASA